MRECSVCGRGHSEKVRTDVYHGAAGPRRLCDDCLFGEIASSWGQPAASPAPMTEAMDEELRLHGLAAYDEYA